MKDPTEKLKAVKRFKIIRNVSIIAVLIAIVCVILFKFLIGVAEVSGKSMLPALEDGDFVLYSRLETTPTYNDVIALQLPTGEKYVKRVVALAGDTVDIKEGILYINGEPLDGVTMEEDGGLTYPLVVPEGSLFTLGDNRSESIDSRFYGTVKLAQVQGIIKLRFHKFTISRVY